VQAEAFYAAHGYVPEGETFVEAEIEHVRMRKSL
jgi:predicted GNAT family N-acyltransferase